MLSITKIDNSHDFANMVTKYKNSHFIFYLLFSVDYIALAIIPFFLL